MSFFMMLAILAIVLILNIWFIIIAFKVLHITYTWRQLWKFIIFLSIFHGLDYLLLTSTDRFFTEKWILFFSLLVLLGFCELWMIYRIFKLIPIVISFTKYIKFIFLQFALSIVFFFIFSSSVGVYISHGFSMMPLISDWDILLVNKLSYKIGSPQYWDIVVMTPWVDKSRLIYIKRVIALPGDSIDFQSWSVFLKYSGQNEWERLNEPYLSEANNGKTFLPAYLENESSQFDIPRNQYWVMWDNRNNSIDSRTCFRNCMDASSNHTLTRENIIGKVIWNLSK